MISSGLSKTRQSTENVFVEMHIQLLEFAFGILVKQMI